MTKIKNIFTRGVVDKDTDERFTSPEVMIDSENFLVTTSDGNNGGVGKNVPGNIKKTEYDIEGGKTIGVGKDESKEKIYNFIKGTTHDYIIEYDVTSDTSEIVLQDVTGGVLNFIEGERITHINIVSSGEVDGDLIVWSGDSNPPRIVNIEMAKTWGIGGFTENEISVMKPSPIFAPSINLTTSIDGLENNFLNDKFIVFATRYKYIDGFYSAPSSWSKIAFEPKEFFLDYQTYENNGMLNLSNAAEITFNTGPREVIEVELLFRESNSQTIYVVENFKKEKENWDDSVNQTIEFSKSKIFKVLPEDQFFRNFDNVPLSAKTQTIIGNRLAYANYEEGYDLEEEVDFNVELISTEPYLSEIDGGVLDFVDEVDTYSNLVDFEKGVEDGGSSPVDQMNFETNTINIDLSGDPDRAEFTIDITPKAGYSSVSYSLYIKEGTTTLFSFTGLSGSTTRDFSIDVDKNVNIFVISSEGLIYDLKLNYNLKTTIGVEISRYDYFAYHQLSFPNSLGYDLSVLEGDTVIDIICDYDLSGFEFTSGNQIRVNFELNSSLVDDFSPSVTYFYNITEDFLDLNDFITNSNFKEILENAFSENFRINEISNEGLFVSYEGFKLSYVGDVLSIKSPIIIYTVTEDSGVVEDKTEFYLYESSNISYISGSSFSSLHSNRDVEVGQIFLDEKGRKSTILVSKDNTIHIPAENSIYVNKVKVNLVSNPPSWARYYKFALKQVKKEYETIFGNTIYEEGIYRWIKLVGENKNKVKEGDLLTIKSDYSGPLVNLKKAKVLEVTSNLSDFIDGNKLPNGKDLIEESGLYMKIKQGDFNINIDDNTFVSYTGFLKRRYASRTKLYTSPYFGEYDALGTTFLPSEIRGGTQIRFYVRMYTFKNAAFDEKVEIKVVAETDYTSVREWWEAEIEGLTSWQNFVDNRLSDYGWGVDDRNFYVQANRDGTQRSDIRLRVIFDINYSGGTLIFETEPKENLSTSFFETPETFNIIDGAYESSSHTLNEAFDCFSFGNGVESFKIQDSFIGKSFSIDSNPNNVNEEGYKKINRFADITYSGIYNSNSGVNKLNEFNLSLANYKDDIEKAYGPIVKIKGQDTNLEVYQEDKCSRVFYGKDLLYNADGTSNLSRIEDVLGQQQTDGGEYGISFHPDSFDEFGFNTYFTDVKRGVVVKKNYNNGLFEASSQLMRSYFKQLFRNNTINHINGKYDQYNDFYILNIQYNNTEYVTWVYSDKNNGWLGRLKFNPEDMIRINNHFITFKNGEIYLHNQENIRNTFYEVESPSEFSFYFSQEPSTRKSFKNIEIEGNTAVDVELVTDINQGYINNTDFEKKEGIFYAYIRNSDDTIDSALLSCQGIGNCTISGLTLNFDFDLDSIISVGDQVRNADLELVGTIVSKTANSLTLNAVANIVSGDFVLCSKPQSISNNDLLGYYMKVTCRFSSNTYKEIFAVNSEVSKSFA